MPMPNSSTATVDSCAYCAPADVVNRWNGAARVPVLPRHARIPDIGALLDRRCQRLSNNARRNAFDLGDIEVTLKRGEKPKCAFGIGEAISDLSPLHGVGPTDAICICRFRRFESLLVWSH